MFFIKASFLFIALVVISLFSISFVEERFTRYPQRFEGVYGEEYGAHRLDLIAKFIPHDPIIFEAGAHYGVDTIKFAAQWPQSRILAFEANPYAFDTFSSRTKAFSNIEGYKLAVHSYNGTTKFHACSGGTEVASSLLEACDHVSPEYQGVEITVPCVVLDDWCKENNVDHIDFMWLDLEGVELLILQHSPEILKTVKVIYTETNFQEVRKGMVQYKDLKAFLERSGFKLVAHWYAKNCQGDAIFVKNEAFSQIQLGGV